MGIDTDLAYLCLAACRALMVSPEGTPTPHSDSLTRAPGSLEVRATSPGSAHQTCRAPDTPDSSTREEMPQPCIPVELAPDLPRPPPQVLSSGSYPRSLPHTGKQAENLRIPS